MPDFLRGLSTAALGAVVFGFFALLTIGSVALGFAAERAKPEQKIFDVPRWAGQLRFEAAGNVVFVAVTTAAFTAALASGAVRFGEAVARGFATFFAMMIGFQVFYYGLHRAMHTKALLRFHRWHHRSQVTSALSAQSVSFVEACAWMIGYVGLPILLSQVVPISFFGWLAYMVFNVSGNIVGHANVELTSKAGATRSASVVANPFVYHALHHARWTGHYSFQAATMDRLFRTEYGDWPALYERVANGRPMKTLQDKG
ncbi:MAG: sterol desaturase family protein [Polyangiaceae bacterium]|nr:sterol desaturase family protein [Polyangiaceae bacterium]